ARLEAASKVLRGDYAKSAYTSRGALFAAAALCERGASDHAKDQLRWLIKTDHDPVATAVARLRLAAILLEEGDYAEGLDLLSKDAPGFEALYADRRGDLYYAQGDTDQAKEQWDAALTSLQGQNAASMVRLKLDALNKE